jgi:hypothetical protein
MCYRRNSYININRCTLLIFLLLSFNVFTRIKTYYLWCSGHRSRCSLYGLMVTQIIVKCNLVQYSQMYGTPHLNMVIEMPISEWLNQGSTQGLWWSYTMVVGFTTTLAISAYHHLCYGFEPYSWWGVLDTTLCDKVYQWLVAGLVVFSRYSGFIHQKSWNIVERGIKHHNS